MSVEQTNVIDFIGIDKVTGNVHLSISDHLPWDRDARRHLELMQAKINAYVRYIESGEYLVSYPELSGRNIAFHIGGKYPLNDEALAFFAYANQVLEGIGISLTFDIVQTQ